MGQVPSTFLEYMRSLEGKPVEIELGNGAKHQGVLQVHGDYVTLKGQPHVLAIAHIASVVPTKPGGQGNISSVTRAAGVRLSELAPLVGEMRRTAESLSSTGREEALVLLDKLKAHTESSNMPDHTLMTMWLKGLSAFVELAPAANRILEMLSGIGA